MYISVSLESVQLGLIFLHVIIICYMIIIIVCRQNTNVKQLVFFYGPMHIIYHSMLFYIYVHFFM